MTATGLRDQARTLADTYRFHLDGIRGDTRLSDDGKRTQIAKLWLDYRRDLAAIRQADAQARADEITRLEARIFRPAGAGGSPTEQAARQMAYRDALDRADALKDDDAGTAAMHRALRSGDADLAQAILSVALDRGWANTANRYLDTHPTVAADVEKLWDLRRQDSDLRLVVTREMHAGTEQRPPELSLFRDDQLEAVADGALTAEHAFGAPLQ